MALALERGAEHFLSARVGKQCTHPVTAAGSSLQVQAA